MSKISISQKDGSITVEYYTYGYDCWGRYETDLNTRVFTFSKEVLTKFHEDIGRFLSSIEQIEAEERRLKELERNNQIKKLELEIERLRKSCQ